MLLDIYSNLFQRFEIQTGSKRLHSPCQGPFNSLPYIFLHRSIFCTEKQRQRSCVGLPLLPSLFFFLSFFSFLFFSFLFFFKEHSLAETILPRETTSFIESGSLIQRRFFMVPSVLQREPLIETIQSFSFFLFFFFLYKNEARFISPARQEERGKILLNAFIYRNKDAKHRTRFQHCQFPFLLFSLILQIIFNLYHEC